LRLQFLLKLRRSCTLSTHESALEKGLVAGEALH
jgi:hypothetical protein